MMSDKNMKVATAASAGVLLLLAILIHAVAQAYGKFSSRPNQDAENGLETTAVALRHLVLGLLVCLGLLQGSTQSIGLAFALFAFYVFISDRR